MSERHIIGTLLILVGLALITAATAVWATRAGRRTEEPGVFEQPSHVRLVKSDDDAHDGAA